MDHTHYKLADSRYHFGIVAISVFVVFLLIGIYLNQYLGKISANNACPLPEAPLKVHGSVALNPSDSENVYDCSGLDIIVASDGEVVFNRYTDNSSDRTGDGGPILLVRNLTIEQGGLITADGLGYQPGEADAGNANAQDPLGNTGGSGGGFGGAGGEGLSDGINGAAQSGSAYSSKENPFGLGGAGSNTANEGIGGNGGGYIQISATENVTIDGVISANGQLGLANTSQVSSGGGGAGGTIIISANSFTGSGTVTAQGAGSAGAVYQGGGGGGGRIQMLADSTNNYLGVVSIAAGNPTGAQAGGVGSLVGPTARPSTPINLKQYKLNAQTILDVGAATSETGLVIRAGTSDPDITASKGEQIFLQIELKPLGTAFTGEINYIQSPGSTANTVCDSAADCVRINITNLARTTQYHWQARVVDNKGGFSNWVAFGGNEESEQDFYVSGLAASISLISGDGQSAVVDNILTNPLIVRVLDAMAQPVPGYAVTWQVNDSANGGALQSGLSTVSDNDGYAENIYKLGTRAVNNIVTARGNGLAGSPVTFSLLGQAGDLASFSIQAPAIALTNSAFNTTITAFDAFNNIKTDFVGNVGLSAVKSIDVNTAATGILSPNNVEFTAGNNGVYANLATSFDTVESIKIKAIYGLQVGYSTAIAVVDSLGSCPDPDGVIDTNQTWVATTANGGIFDCRGIDITIINNAILTLDSYDSGDSDYTNDLGTTILADSIDVSLGARISADGQGYTNRGPGRGTSYGGGCGGTCSGGGGYGGYGGDYTRAGGTAYGDLYQPYNLGSGITSGGGAIKLITSDYLIIEGQITSYGNAGSGNTGAGSGGSIWIETNSLQGAGSIKADGGNNGGAGGRLAVYYYSTSGNILSSLATTSPLITSYGKGSGGPGTIYVEQCTGWNMTSGCEKQGGHLTGEVFIDNNNSSQKPAAIGSLFNSSATSFDLAKLTLKRYGKLDIVGSESILNVSASNELTGDGTKPNLTVYGTFIAPNDLEINGVNVVVRGEILLGGDTSLADLTIGNTQNAGLDLYAYTWAHNSASRYEFNDIVVASKGILTLTSYDSADSDYTNDYGLNLKARNITTEYVSGSEYGKVIADSKGYSNRGPGRGTSYGGGCSGTCSGGGGYGGYGGDYARAGGTAYGDLYQPIDLGSGILPGGGAMKLQVTENLTNNGLISSLGANGSGNNGAGSGGSIWIEVNNLVGSGNIKTDGGANGGAGGRIAIYHFQDNSSILNTLGTDTPKVTSYGNGSGGPGTIFIEQCVAFSGSCVKAASHSSGMLFVDNNNRNYKRAAIGNLINSSSVAFSLEKISLRRYGNLDIVGNNSVLLLTDPAAIVGDATIPSLTIYGTLMGPEVLDVNGINMGIHGNINLNDDNSSATLNIGNVNRAGVTLYANTWVFNNTHQYEFGAVNVSEASTLTLVSYDNADSDYTNDYGVSLQAEDFNVAGTITANTKGYINRGIGNTSAYGGGCSGTCSGGGGHGGYGATYVTSGGTAYGDLYEPIDLGSGIAGGGGAIKIIAKNELNIQSTGSITSLGGNGAVNTGAGSGGSIWIQANDLVGSGSIKADGGANGGAGGRIALYYNNDNSSIISSLGTVSPRVTTYGFGGGPGTIFTENCIGWDIYGCATTGNHATGSLFVNNNNVNGRSAAIGDLANSTTQDFQLATVSQIRNGHLDVVGDDSTITITQPNNITGDGSSTLNVYGSFIAPDNIAIEGITLGVRGEIEIGEDTSTATINIGNSATGGVNLYANTWAHNSSNQYAFGDINIGSFGTMSLTSYDNANSDYTDDYGVTITANNISIASEGKLNADYLGYLNRGPGVGSLYYGGCSGNCSGGSGHGGLGASFAVAGGNAYGDVYQPVTMGSGYNARGGGAIKLLVNNELSNNGTISSLGANGGNNNSAASGGSIWIETSEITGNGTIKADGGANGASGGRIAIYYYNDNSNILNTLGTINSKVSNLGKNGGGSGTTYIEQCESWGVDGCVRFENHVNGSLFIDNAGSNGQTAAIGELFGSEVTEYLFNEITLNRYGHLSVIGETATIEIVDAEKLNGDGTSRLDVYGTFIAPDGLEVNGVTLGVRGEIDLGGNTSQATLNIGNTTLAGVNLYANTWAHNDVNTYVFKDLNIGEHGSLNLYSYDNADSDYTNDYGVTITTENINIATGGLVSASQKGYQNRGPGVGSLYYGGCSGNCSGGSGHGGYGGTNGLSGGNPYGDLYQPITLGSGYGTSGGGAIKLVATSRLTNNGSIISDGGAGGVNNSAGSGGSIWIDTDELAGTGSITTNGGNAGGSGGRIAIYYSSDLDNMISQQGSSVANVKAYGQTNGGPGTTYLERKGYDLNQQGSIYIDSNGVAGRGMNFEARNWSLNNLYIGKNISVMALGDSDSEDPKGVRFYLAGNFVLDTGAFIDGRYQGFSSSVGFGKGGDATGNAGGGGGAYGGAGGPGESAGVPSDNGIGGTAYGASQQMQPLSLGSGGGKSGTGSAGGKGGGAVLIDARNGDITILGNINVSGEDGYVGSPAGGGGSGGSILIIGDTCDISGDLIAEGGDGGDGDFDGGGGGGGRVSILSSSATSDCETTGLVSVEEGVSILGGIGQIGTYFGVQSLPSATPESQSRTDGSVIPVGGATPESIVNLTAQVFDPGADELNPITLVAEFQLSPLDDSLPLLVSSDPINFNGGEPEVITLPITNGLEVGQEYAWKVRVTNIDQGIVANWVEYGNNGEAADFKISTVDSFAVNVSDTNIDVGEAIDISVDAIDINSQIVTDYTGTITFISEPDANPSPILPPNYSFTITDAGQYQQNAAITFYAAGTYIISVTDTVNSSITGQSQQITVNALATPTPSVVVTTPVVTTPGVTDNVPSTTEINVTEIKEQSCFENVNQAKCQLNVSISNVRINTDTEQQSAEICWDTNLQTIGSINYGSELLSETTAVETVYKYNNHCQTITDLETEMVYNFRITATSYAGKSAVYDGVFAINLDELPPTGEAKECIIFDNYAFNGSGEAVLTYKTAYLAKCVTVYSASNSLEKLFAKPDELLPLLNHSQSLSLKDQEKDILYEIKCGLNEEGIVESGVTTCNYNGIIPQKRFASYMPKDDMDISSEGFTGVMQTLGFIAPIVTLTALVSSVAISTFNLPQLLRFGYFWIVKRKKKQAWGLIYDGREKKPIAFAVIRILDRSNGKLIKEEVSNLEGKYNVLIGKGDYLLTIEHSDYNRIEKEIKLDDDENTVAEDIAMMHVRGINPQPEIEFKHKLQIFLTKANNSIVIIGGLVTLIAVITNPGWFNLLVVALYIIQAATLLKANSIRWGRVIDVDTNKPLAGVMVKLYEATNYRQLETTLTDKNGSFRFLTDDGDYLISTYLNGYSNVLSSNEASNGGVVFIKVKVIKARLAVVVKLKQDK